MCSLRQEHSARSPGLHPPLICFPSSCFLHLPPTTSGKQSTPTAIPECECEAAEASRSNIYPHRAIQSAISQRLINQPSSFMHGTTPQGL